MPKQYSSNRSRAYNSCGLVARHRQRRGFRPVDLATVPDASFTSPVGLVLNVAGPQSRFCSLKAVFSACPPAVSGIVSDGRDVAGENGRLGIWGQVRVQLLHRGGVFGGFALIAPLELHRQATISGLHPCPPQKVPQAATVMLDLLDDIVHLIPSDRIEDDSAGLLPILLSGIPTVRRSTASSHVCRSPLGSTTLAKVVYSA